MSTFKFTPESQRILMLPDKGQDKVTRGGIIIPGVAENEKPLTGVVIAVGSGEAERPMKYKVGQRILCSTFAGIDVTIDIHGHGRNEYKVMNQIDVMGLLEEVEED